MEMFPDAIITIGDMASTYKFREAPPVCWHIPLEQVNNESPSSIDIGRYRKDIGEAQGIAKPLLQDTTLASGKNTGRTFTVVSGTWKDDSKPADKNYWRLLMPDATASVTFEVTSTTTTTTIERAQIIIGRGVVPNGVTPTRSNYNCYLHLAYGGTYDYRFCMEWEAPMRLEYTEDAGVTYKGVAIASSLGNFNQYIRRNPYVTLNVEADTTRNAISVEIGEGHFLRHTMPKKLENGQYTQRSLPSPGKLRLVGQNGWASLEYYPLRYETTVTASKGERDFGRAVFGQSGFIVANSQSPGNASQTLSTTITQTSPTSVKATVTATAPDDGSGNGATSPPILSDFTVVIPAVWRDAIGIPDYRIGFLRGMRVEELQVADPITRVTATSAVVSLNNFDGYYTNVQRHFATTIDASNGVSGYDRRLTGIAGVGSQGWKAMRHDPMRVVNMQCVDRSFAMGSRPSDAPISLAQEVNFDGWCLFSAVQYLCEVGNIHPSQLSPNIPFYVPPNATTDAPYGPAGADCPFPILPRGTGLNPKLNFLPDASPWSVLMQLCQDSAAIDPITGSPAPYYMGFDEWGIFHFEPVSFASQAPKIVYSDNDASGFGQIESIEVCDSIYNLRTGLDFEGISAETYELLYYHLPMPDEVLVAVGFAFDWLERNARYATPEYLQYITQAAAIQAYLPTKIVRMRVPFHSFVRAGDVCIINESQALGGVGLFVIEEMYSVYGQMDLSGKTGYQECYSIVTARSLLNYL